MPPVLVLQVSVNDCVIKAVALALADVPAANCYWDVAQQAVVPTGAGERGRCLQGILRTWPTGCVDMPDLSCSYQDRASLGQFVRQSHAGWRCRALRCLTAIPPWAHVSGMATDTRPTAASQP